MTKSLTNSNFFPFLKNYAFPQKNNAMFITLYNAKQKHLFGTFLITYTFKAQYKCLFSLFDVEVWGWGCVYCVHQHFWCSFLQKYKYKTASREYLPIKFPKKIFLVKCWQIDNWGSMKDLLITTKYAKDYVTFLPRHVVSVLALL